MTRRPVLPALALAGVLALSGCASVSPENQLRNDVAAITDAANAGNADRLRSEVDDLLSTLRTLVGSQDLSAERASRIGQLAEAIRADADLIDTDLIEQERTREEQEAERQRLEEERRQLEAEREAQQEEERRRAEAEASASAEAEAERQRQEEEERRREEEDDDDDDVVPSPAAQPTAQPTASPAGLSVGQSPSGEDEG